MVLSARLFIKSIMKKILTIVAMLSTLVFASCGGSSVEVGKTYTNEAIGLSFSYPNGYEIADEEAGESLLIHVKNTENTDTELTDIIVSVNAASSAFSDVDYKFESEVVDGRLTLVDSEKMENGQATELEQAYTQFQDSTGLDYFLFVSTNLSEDEMLAIFRSVAATIHVQ